MASLIWRKELVLSLVGRPRVPILHLPVPPMGGHPVSQRQSSARHTPPLRPQGPKMQGVGQGSADPN